MLVYWIFKTPVARPLCVDQETFVTAVPSASVWPLELKLTDQGRLLSIAYDTGESFDLRAEYLRVESPSAEVQGHSAAQKQTIGGKQNVVISKIEPVGNYAVRLIFDDGHQSGIFTWAYMYELGSQEARKWGDYLARLSAKGLSRSSGSA